MPKIKSAKKALRQNARRKKLNLEAKKKVRRSVKAYQGSLKTGSKEEMEKSLATAYQSLDKAAKRGTIKKNTASRLKSRLAKKINK
ncbi:MAG: 30S ribosomal protein S20 [Patescibacteria group bacterium]|nr:30S ribosomal protein S20 [Patescibacteria group bacterium]